MRKASLLAVDVLPMTDSSAYGMREYGGRGVLVNGKEGKREREDRAVTVWERQNGV